MTLTTIPPVFDAISRFVISVDYGTTFSAVALTLISPNHRLIQWQSNTMGSGKQSLNRERLENRYGGLMYQLVNTPRFDDTHRTTDLEVSQELLRCLPQINGLMMLKRLQYGLELTSTIPRSLDLEANAQGSTESFLNQLMGVLQGPHRDDLNLGQDHRGWHADVKPQSILGSAGLSEVKLADLGLSSFSIDVDRAERLDCQFPDKPSRSAISLLEQCAQYSWTNAHCFFSNPAAASPGSDYGDGGHAIISHLHGIGGVRKATLARDFVASFHRDERHESYFWTNAKDWETRCSSGCLKQTLGSVAAQVRQLWDSKLGSPAVDMEDSVSRRDDTWSLGCVSRVPSPFPLMTMGERTYERASTSRLTACVHHPRVLYRYEKGDRHSEGTFLGPHDSYPSLTEDSDSNRGDMGIGPQAGKPNLGREDDDDDDCVGFRRLSGPKHRRGTLQGDGTIFRGKLTDMRKYRAGDVHPAQPRYGPPYRGLVDATPGKVVVHSPSTSIVSIWREAIARTCGERNISDPSPMAWESAGKEGNGDNSIYMGARGGGNGILCAH